MTIFCNSIQYSQTGGWQVPADGDFPIVGFNICFDEGSFPTDSTFKTLENGGINLFVNYNRVINGNDSIVYNSFNSYRSHYPESKLKLIMQIAGIVNNTSLYSQINPLLNKFTSNSVYGYFIWDEPWDIPNKGNNDLADINHLVEQLKSNPNSKSRLAAVDLMPIYWDKISGAERYKEYIDNFYNSQTNRKPQILMVDYYPYLTFGVRNNFFQGLKVLKDKSLQYNVPFWIIVLSSKHLSYIDPTINDIRLQVYSSLAYGAKGIAYYLYSLDGDYSSAILQSNFNKPSAYHGEKYNDVKILNKEITMLGKTLLKLTPFAIYHNDSDTNNIYPNGQKGINDELLNNNNNRSFDVIENIAGTDSNYAMVGYFQHQITKEEYFLIVNKDFNNSHEFTIKLKNNVRAIYEISKTTGSEVLFDSNSKLIKNVFLRPGDGRLFKF